VKLDLAFHVEDLFDQSRAEGKEKFDVVFGEGDRHFWCSHWLVVFDGSHLVVFEGRVREAVWYSDS
jgi:hypothetical protein